MTKEHELKFLGSRSALLCHHFLGVGRCGKRTETSVALVTRGDVSC